MRVVAVLALILAVASGCRQRDGCAKDTDCKGVRVCEARQCKRPHKLPTCEPAPLPKAYPWLVEMRVVKVAPAKVKGKAPLVTLELHTGDGRRKVLSILVGWKVYFEGRLQNPPFTKRRFAKIDRVYADATGSSDAKLLKGYQWELDKQSAKGGKNFAAARPAKKWPNAGGSSTQAAICPGPFKLGARRWIKVRFHGGLECHKAKVAKNK